ncbi:MAG: TSUP family transporter [Actinobacteria bacterium]|nr:TSUP family transporter [Actinomycetota bacterium]
MGRRPHVSSPLTCDDTSEVYILSNRFRVWRDGGPGWGVAAGLASAHGSAGGCALTGGQTVVLLLSVLVASTTQVTVGFGFALLSVPLMTMAVPTREAVVISTILGLLTSSFQAWHGRRDADRTLIRRLTSAALVGLPIGWLVFTRVPDDVLRAILGMSVLVAVMLLATGLVARGSTRLDVLCGALSGALASSLSTNGPPLVFALQARSVPMRVFRPTINTVFTFSGLLSLVAFALSGEIESDAVVHALWSVPVLLAGSRIGFLLRVRVREEHARRIVLTLLTLAGLSAILAAIV